MDVDLGLDLCFFLVARRDFSALAVLRGRGIGVDVGSDVQVGSGVEEGAVVLSGVIPAVGVGVSASTGPIETPPRTMHTSRPPRQPRRMRPDL